MSIAFAQNGRRGQITTALGKDALVLLRFAGADKLNDLFTYHIEALSNERWIDFDALLGTHVTFQIATPHGDRPFDGIVEQVEWLGAEADGHRFLLTLRPWLWLAGLRRNQRIFHDKTVVEILTELLQDYAGLGNPALENRLTGSYPVLEYTVQYRESDLAFACRLMERFGISYHFTHAIGSHSMVLTDTIESHSPIGIRPYRNYEGQQRDADEHFWVWRKKRGVTTGAIKLTDWNFKTPPAQMLAESTGDAPHAQGAIESFDYPGDYLEQGRGKTVAKMRTSQERGQNPRVYAEGDVAMLSSGLRIGVKGDDLPPDSEREFLCLAASHTYLAEGYRSGTMGEGDAFAAQYSLMPTDAPLAPRRKTATAVVQGPQTAVVVGEGEIDCDAFGRILVRFHWDLDDAYSMRCRVSQSWAGKGWGGMVIPRIGMEVVVEFLEGDPDKPLVTGCVYNGKNPVPYTLPDDKTRSTFKTQTHEGSGFNELRFEDAKDKEEIFVHAQKDRNSKIENNQTERVNVNKVESVGNNMASEITNMMDQVVGGDYRVFVGPGQRGKFTPGSANDAVEGIGATAYGLGKKGGIGGSGNMEVTIEKDLSESVGRNVSQVLGKVKTTSVGKSYYIDVKEQYVLDVGDKITVKCGQSVITLDKAGNIAINGKVITATADQLIKLLADVVKIN